MLTRRLLALAVRYTFLRVFRAPGLCRPLVSFCAATVWLCGIGFGEEKRRVGKVGGSARVSYISFLWNLIINRQQPREG